ncbi:MAG: response regulator, partial [Planctomycetales bacterium]
MPTLIAIDDDSSVLLLLRRTFQQTDVDLHTANTASEGLRLIESQQADAVILDILLPDMSGLEAYQQLRQRNAKVPVIFITASDDSSMAIEAMKLGAYDYLTKPLNVRRLRELTSRALEISRLMNVPVETPEHDSPLDLRDSLVGRCDAMQEVYKAIGRVAPQDLTVLIQGETGTGKELIARAIYQHSARNGKPFLAVNCAAIPDQLL